MAVKPHGLATRPGEPYPATFRIQWTHRESNSDLQPAELVSSHWTMSPCFEWTVWESTPSHRPCKGQSPPSACRPNCFCRGPSGNRTRSPSLPRTCASGTPTDHFARVIPAGIELALSCRPRLRRGARRRRLRRWTTGSLSVTEAGIEPAKSPRSGHRRAALVGDRFACLRTRP